MDTLEVLDKADQSERQDGAAAVCSEQMNPSIHGQKARLRWTAGNSLGLSCMGKGTHTHK